MKGRKRHALRPFLIKRWPALLVALVATVASSAADLARPFPLKFVIDRILTRSPNQAFHLEGPDLVLLAWVGVLMLAIALADALASYHMDVQLERAGEHIVHDVRVALYEHMQRLSLAFHERRHAGDLVTGLTGDVDSVGRLFSDSLGTIVASALTLVGMIVVALLIDPVLALVILATVPIMAYVAWRFRANMRFLARRERAKDGEIASVATETLSAMRVVKALGSERLERKRLRQLSEDRRSTGIEAARVEGRFGGLIDVVGAVGSAVILVLGVFRVASGALSPGDLVVLFSYVKKIYRPLSDIVRHANKISQAVVRADRIAEVLENDDLLEDRPGAYRGPRATGAVEVQDISFAYEPMRPALSNASVRIAAGQRVALVGRSGAGKSTLAALVARFYDPDCGRILVDGRDLRDCSLRWLRRQIALVLQDTALFTGTVAENIAYGIDAGREQIVAAARAAGADEFIADLPAGYDTRLGPRGAALSGGQRQRIAIARALLRDSPILILDEPTTGLDAESEEAVLRGLERLMRNRTTIIITHSLGLARNADLVVMLEDGAVVEEGSPQELLQREGRFRRLVDRDDTASAPLHRSVSRDPTNLDFGRLLDPDAATAALQRTLGRHPEEPFEPRVRRVHYSPGTRVVVHYAVRIGESYHDATATMARHVDLAKRAGKPQNIALAHLVDGRSPSTMPLSFDPDLEALVQWLPLDLSLPALAQPPEALRSRLALEGILVAEDPWEPELLAYRPRKRAVIRLGDRVLKMYGSEDEYRAATLAIRAASTLRRVRTAPLLATVPEWRLAVFPFLAGAAPDPTMPERVGASLAELHGSSPPELPRFGPMDLLQTAARGAAVVGAVAPTSLPRMERVIGKLAAQAPPPTASAPSHGDFRLDQMIEADGELVFLDLDAFCLAPPALDPATYASVLVNGGEGDLEQAAAVLDALLGGYGRPPDHLSWYLAACILRRVPVPFRRQDRDWPERIEGLIEAADRMEGLIAEETALRS